MAKQQVRLLGKGDLSPETLQIIRDVLTGQSTPAAHPKLGPGQHALLFAAMVVYFEGKYTREGVLPSITGTIKDALGVGDSRASYIANLLRGSGLRKDATYEGKPAFTIDLSALPELSRLVGELKLSQNGAGPVATVSHDMQLRVERSAGNVTPSVNATVLRFGNRAERLRDPALFDLFERIVRDPAFDAELALIVLSVTDFTLDAHDQELTDAVTDLVKRFTGDKPEVLISVVLRLIEEVHAERLSAN